jgi:hypothetical protein
MHEPVPAGTVRRGCENHPPVGGIAPSMRLGPIGVIFSPGRLGGARPRPPMPSRQN